MSDRDDVRAAFEAAMSEIAARFGAGEPRSTPGGLTRGMPDLETGWMVAVRNYILALEHAAKVARRDAVSLLRENDELRERLGRVVVDLSR